MRHRYTKVDNEGADPLNKAKSKIRDAFQRSAVFKGSDSDSDVDENNVDLSAYEVRFSFCRSTFSKERPERRDGFEDSIHAMTNVMLCSGY